MTVRKLEDPLGGVVISEENSQLINEYEIWYETTHKFSLVATALRKSSTFNRDKEIFANNLDTFLRESENNRFYSIARIFGIVEVKEHDKDVLTGFYIFFPSYE